MLGVIHSNSACVTAARNVLNHRLSKDEKPKLSSRPAGPAPRVSMTSRS